MLPKVAGDKLLFAVENNFTHFAERLKINLTHFLQLRIRVYVVR